MHYLFYHVVLLSSQCYHLCRPVQLCGEVQVLAKAEGATLMFCWAVCCWRDHWCDVTCVCLGSSLCRNAALIARFVARVLRDHLLCPRTCSSTQTPDPIRASTVGSGFTRNLIWRNTPSFTQVSPAAAGVSPNMRAGLWKGFSAAVHSSSADTAHTPPCASHCPVAIHAIWTVLGQRSVIWMWFNEQQLQNNLQKSSQSNQCSLNRIHQCLFKGLLCKMICKYYIHVALIYSWGPGKMTGEFDYSIAFCRIYQFTIGTTGVSSFRSNTKLEGLGLSLNICSEVVCTSTWTFWEMAAVWYRMEGEVQSSQVSLLLINMETNKVQVNHQRK